MEPDNISTMLYYLFSGTAQTFGAMLGVIGMVAIYKMQLSRQFDETFRKRLQFYYYCIIPIEFGEMTIQELYHLSSKIDKDKLTEENRIYYDGMNKIIESINFSTALRRTYQKLFASFAITSLFVICISITLLYLMPVLTIGNNNILYIYILLYLIIVFIGIYSAYSLLRLLVG